jgi:hypothetical protein
MFRFVQSLWPLASVKRKSPGRRALRVEELGTRAVPSASPVTLTSSGTLIVRGTAGDDTVSVTMDANVQNQLDVFYNDDTTPFSTFDVTQTPVNRISFLGLAGNDSFTNATAVSSNLNGGTGNDTLVGGAGNDKITGGAGDDSLSGGDGNDSISGGTGNDVIDGGDGNNKITGDAGNDTITAGAGNDTITGGSGDDLISGGDGNDSIHGNSGNDSILGGAGDDILFGDTGNDSIDGGDGNDSISGGAGNDSLEGGFGNDTILGVAGNDSIDGGLGDDSILGGSGSDTIDGGLGNDTCVGGAGVDQVDGGVGQDDVTGNDVADPSDSTDYWVVLTERDGQAIGSAELLTSTDANGDAHTDVQVIILNAPANTTFDVQIDAAGDGTEMVTLGQLTTDGTGAAEFDMSDPPNMPALQDGASAVEVTDVNYGGTDDLRGTIANLNDNWLGANLSAPHNDFGLTFGAAALNLTVGKMDIAVQGLVPDTTYLIYANGDATTGTLLGQFTTDDNGNGQFELASGTTGVDVGSTMTIANADGLTAMVGTFAVVSGDDGM